MRKRGAFLAGLSVGALMAGNWRAITKGTVKAGIRSGSTLRTAAARASENLADVVHEATWEMTGPAGPPDPSTNGGATAPAHAATPAS